MGTTDRGIYLPAIAEGDWGEEVNDNLSRLADLAYNVKAYGATGNGSTNDATAIQSAITAADAAGGGIVYFPRGTYPINSTLNVSKSMLVGAGQRATNLVHNAGTNPLIKATGTLAPSGLSFRDFRVAGANTSVTPGTGTGPAIFLDGTGGGGSYITVQSIVEVEFDGVGAAGVAAVKGVWALETFIVRCMFRSCPGVGIRLEQTSNACVIRDCTLSNGGVGEVAISLDNVRGTTIDGCIIEAWRGSAGIRANGVDALSIRDCWLEQNYGDQILVESTIMSANVGIHGCYFSPEATNTTSNATITALAATVSNCSISTKNIVVNDPGGGNDSNYNFIGNRFVSAADVINNTTATLGYVTFIGNRGTLSVGQHVRTTGSSNRIIADGGIHTRVVATGVLPAAATAMNGHVLIEDAGAGDRNLIIYAGGQRFRIDGGTNF